MLSVFRCMMICCLAVSILPAAQLDPQINVMNVGSVIDVAPTVSSDRKYITLGVGGGSSNLVRLNRAHIITLDVLGLPLFNARPEEILRGNWQANDPYAHKDQTNKTWQINVDTNKVNGHCGKPIHAMAIKKWSRKDNTVLLQIAHADTSQQRRSATTGAVRPPKLEYTYIKGKFSEDMHTISGQVVADNKKKNIELRRAAPKLGKSMFGTWACKLQVAHKSFKGQRSHSLNLKLNKFGIAAAWPAVKDMKVSVLRYDPKKRHLIALVSYKKSDRSRKYSFGYINGKFDKTFTQFDACFETDDYGQAHIQMSKN